MSQAGYNAIEITAYRPGLSEPLLLFKANLGPVNSVGVVVLPESLGRSCQITVKATKLAEPGLVFSKVYTITEGAVGTMVVSVKPADPIVDIVPPPLSVAILPSTLSLSDAGDTATLKAQVLPVQARQEVFWKSSNPAVAAVDAAGLVGSGIVGTARITALALADSTKLGFIQVTVVKPLKVDSVVLAEKAARLFLGGPDLVLHPRMVPAEAPALLTWRSSNEAVAKVSADGKVSGAAAGEARISAQYKGDKGDANRADTCRITVVKDAPVLDVGRDTSVTVGATVTFAPKVSQEFGGIVAFKWSLDGDTVWEGSDMALPAGLSQTYTAIADVYAYFSVKDGEGNIVVARRLVRVVATLDTKAPEVSISAPVAGAITNKNVLAVAWTVDGVPQSTRLVETVILEGENAIVRDAVDSAGNRGSDTVKVIRDTQAPEITIPELGNLNFTHRVTQAAFTLSAAVKDPVSGVASVTVTGPGGGAMAQGSSNGPYTRDLTLALGTTLFTVTAVDRAGNSSTAMASLTYYDPVISITWPPDGFVTNLSMVRVKYSVTSGSNIDEKTLEFSPTAEGVNTITVSEENAVPQSIKIHYLPKVVFVRKEATGNGNGTSWTDAYSELRFAMNSVGGSTDGNSIWVSGGNYEVEKEGVGNPLLASGVSMYGGFPTTGNPVSLSARNFITFRTTVTNSPLSPLIPLQIFGGTATVDGFTLTTDTKDVWALLVVNSANLTISNCEFHSTARLENTLDAWSSVVKADRCTFSNLSTVSLIVSRGASKIDLDNSSILNNNLLNAVYLMGGSSFTLNRTKIIGNKFTESDGTVRPSDVYADSTSRIIKGTGNSSDMPQFSP
ncbi:MAG: Ig-like domain-containing protein [Fibrobacteria bacterium]